MPIHYHQPSQLSATQPPAQALPPVRVITKQIPYGNAGIMVSAKEMVNMVKMFRKNQDRVRFLAEDIVKGCANKDYYCEARKLYDWIKSNIAFRRDINHVEMLRSPIVTLDRRAGDCDCHTILYGSLAQSIGLPTRIVLVATRRNKPKNFNHVFSEVQVPVNGVLKWLPADTTPLTVGGPTFAFGELPPAYTYKRLEII